MNYRIFTFSTYLCNKHGSKVWLLLGLKMNIFARIPVHFSLSYELSSLIIIFFIRSTSHFFVLWDREAGLQRVDHASSSFLLDHHLFLVSAVNSRSFKLFVTNFFLQYSSCVYFSNKKCFSDYDKAWILLHVYSLSNFQLLVLNSGETHIRAYWTSL